MEDNSTRSAQQLLPVNRGMRWVGHVAHSERDAYKILVGTCEGKSSLERPRRRREDNIMMDVKNTSSM
jgi:hypothetical protein